MMMLYSKEEAEKNSSLCQVKEPQVCVSELSAARRLWNGTVYHFSFALAQYSIGQETSHDHYQKGGYQLVDLKYNGAYTTHDLL